MYYRIAIPANAPMPAGGCLSRVFVREAERRSRIMLLRLGAVGLFQAPDLPAALPAADS